MEFEFEIFRAGKYPQGDFTEADLDQIVQAYDPKIHEAPITLDHGKTGPAYGWVAGLKRVGKTLVASFRDVAEELKGLVEAGRYKKRSAEIYTNFAGTGKKYLKAVAFLGAAVPEVKGLAEAKFAENAGDSVAVEFGERWGWQAAKSLFRRLKNMLIEDKGQERAEEILPEWSLDDLATAEQEAAKEETPAFKEAGHDNDLKAEEEEMQIAEFKEKVKGRLKKALEANKVSLTDKEIEAIIEEPGVTSFSEADVAAARKQAEEAGRKKAEAEFAEKNRRVETEAFVDGLVKEGKLAPALKASGLVEFMARLDGAEAVQFAEKGDKLSPRDWFKKLLQGAGKIIVFGEVAPTGKDIPDADEAKREELIAKFQEQNKEATYKQATLAIAKKHPELFGIERRR
jgi:hypothetical protein